MLSAPSNLFEIIFILCFYLFLQKELTFFQFLCPKSQYINILYMYICSECTVLKLYKLKPWRQRRR